MSIIKRFKLYLKSGTGPDLEDEANTQIMISNLFSLIGFSITFTMGLNAFIKSNYLLAASLFGASFLFFITQYINRIVGLRDKHKHSGNLLLSILTVLMLYLVYSGGADNTGPLWIYIVPPVALFFSGVKRGLINIGGFLLIVSIMMFHPHPILLDTEYSYAFKSRLILSFMTVTFLFSVYEFFRQKSYEKIHELSAKFEQQARKDPLTQLPNRRGMIERGQQELKRAKRSKKNMSLMMCDIDHFKQINDKYGHEGGDKILHALAIEFRKLVRQQDIVSRWGGEEFLFLLPETNATEACVLAEKLRNKIEDHVFTYNDTSIKLTLCLGVSEVEDIENFDKAMKQADLYLYQAKRDGRNCVRSVIS